MKLFSVSLLFLFLLTIFVFFQKTKDIDQSVSAKVVPEISHSDSTVHQSSFPLDAASTPLKRDNAVIPSVNEAQFSTKNEAPSSLHNLSNSEQQSLRKAFSEAKREVRTIPETWTNRPENVGYDFYALHPNQHLTTRFGSSGTQFVSANRTNDVDKNQRNPTSAWQAQMRLLSFAGEKVPANTAPQKSERSSTLLEYPHSSSLTEWFDNGTDGIEHGYTIDSRPTNLGDGTSVSLEVSLDGLEVSTQEKNGEDNRLVFMDGDREVLSYSKLLVVDANGKHLPAYMEPTKNGFSIAYNDSSATYPVTIDPLIINEEAKLNLFYPTNDDHFGKSVAIWQETAVIGAPGDSLAGVNSGAAYIFVRMWADTWVLRGRISASDATSGDSFGSSVAIFHQTIAIGAPGDDDGGSNSGSAYIFTLVGTKWTQHAKLTASDASGNDSFGTSLSVSTNLTIIGAPGDDDNGDNSGAAYAFSRANEGPTWSQEAKITASDGAAGDGFGSALSGTFKAIVGAPGNDENGIDSGAAYAFVRIGGVWTDEAKLTASDAAAGDLFGQSVHFWLSAIIGAPGNDDHGNDSGAAYVFQREAPDNIWVQTAKLTASDAAADDQFGCSVGMGEGYLVVGAAGDDDHGIDSGSAYVFQFSASIWSELTKITASDPNAGDSFGSLVYIFEGKIFASAPNNNGIGTDPGAVYAFARRSGTTWQHQGKITDPEAMDRFGISVAISDNTLVIGDESDFDNGTFSGSAYVFTRSGSNWSSQGKLVASDGAPNDFFGESVSISGDSVIVGSRQDRISNQLHGSAYVFTRTGTTWSQQAKLNALGFPLSTLFGDCVAISGDTAVVGAREYRESGINSGCAYVYTRSGSNWSHQAHLIPSDGASGDQFGSSVAISGDYLVVGSHQDDDDGSKSGSAYIFNRTGSTWSEQAKLTASDAASEHRFGQFVDISSDTAAIGSISGAAYVFIRNGTSWSQEARLTSSDTNSLGSSVSLSGDSLLVGSTGDDDGGENAGATYFFFRYNSTWIEQAKLIPSDAAPNDLFGFPVALSGDTAIGEYRRLDEFGKSKGSVFIFNLPNIRAINPNDAVISLGTTSIFPEQEMNTNQPFVFRLLNGGERTIDIQSISLSGADADQFSLTLPDISSTEDLSLNQFLDYTITFSPTGTISAPRNATVTIVSNDKLPEFSFSISGMSFSSSTDTDSDGLNDWAEFSMRNFGFDWEVSQPDEVSFYYDSASSVGLYTRAEAASVTGSVKLAEIDPSTDTGVFEITLEESLDLNTTTKHNANPAKLSVDSDGNLRYELEAPPSKKIYRANLKP